MAKLSLWLTFVRFQLASQVTIPSIIQRMEWRRPVGFCFLIWSCPMINPNNLSFWWCFFFPSRWFQTLPVGMPVPTALQGAVWYPLKSHRTPRSSKKAPSETWLPSILWLLGGVCSHNWPVTGQPSGNQCRGPAPADPGYSKRGRRRRPI